jgi:hypothetical protein
MGRLEASLANIRKAWKKLSRDKRSSLFYRGVGDDEQKRFFNIDTCGQYYKHITIMNDISKSCQLWPQRHHLYLLQMMFIVKASLLMFSIYDCNVFIVQPIVCSPKLFRFRPVDERRSQSGKRGRSRLRIRFAGERCPSTWAAPAVRPSEAGAEERELSWRCFPVVRALRAKKYRRWTGGQDKNK